MSDAQEFIAAARRAGLLIDEIDGSGAVRRVPLEGDQSGRRSGWYVFHAAAPAWAMFGNWNTGELLNWRSSGQRMMSAAARAQLNETIRRYQEDQRQRRGAEYMHARGEALRELTQASPADPAHPYLAAKGVGAYGIRQAGDCLLIPLCDAKHDIWSVQRIDAEGNKHFLAGARKHGLFHLIGPEPSAVLCIAEDYATCASIHESTGYPVAVAFDSCNLEPVAAKLRRQYPNAQLVLCGEVDTTARPGITRGVEAAQNAASATGGVPSRDAKRARSNGHVCRDRREVTP